MIGCSKSFRTAARSERTQLNRKTSPDSSFIKERDERLQIPSKKVIEEFARSSFHVKSSGTFVSA
jgi:hypothetical protein